MSGLTATAVGYQPTGMNHSRRRSIRVGGDRRSRLQLSGRQHVNGVIAGTGDKHPAVGRQRHVVWSHADRDVADPPVRLCVNDADAAAAPVADIEVTLIGPPSGRNAGAARRGWRLREQACRGSTREFRDSLHCRGRVSLSWGGDGHAGQKKSAGESTRGGDAFLPERRARWIYDPVSMSSWCHVSGLPENHPRSVFGNPTASIDR